MAHRGSHSRLDVPLRECATLSLGVGNKGLRDRVDNDLTAQRAVRRDQVVDLSLEADELAAAVLDLHPSLLVVHRKLRPPRVVLPEAPHFRVLRREQLALRGRECKQKKE